MRYFVRRSQLHKTPQSGVPEARAAKLEPRAKVQGSGKVAGKVLTVDLQGRFAKLLI